MAGSLNDRIFLSHSFCSWLLFWSLVGVLQLSQVVPTLAQSTPNAEQPTPASPSTTPARSTIAPTRSLLKQGSKGAEVTELQAVLKLLGYFDGAVDGTFGQTTVAAVSAFQKAAGLGVDGVVGPATWNRLFPPTSGSPTPTPTPVTGPSSNKPSPAKPAPATATQPTQPSTQPSTDSVTLPILRLGTKGPAVRNLQERLRTIGVFSGQVDGVFGPETQNAVKAAQRKFKLEPDGVVGPATWNALLR